MAIDRPHHDYLHPLPYALGVAKYFALKAMPSNQLAELLALPLHPAAAERCLRHKQAMKLASKVIKITNDDRELNSKIAAYDASLAQSPNIKQATFRVNKKLHDTFGKPDKGLRIGIQLAVGPELLRRIIKEPFFDKQVDQPLLAVVSYKDSELQQTSNMSDILDEMEKRLANKNHPSVRGSKELASFEYTFIDLAVRSLQTRR